MAYRLDPRLFLEDGPAIRAAEAHARSSSDAFRAWAALDAERRLELVETALRRPANDDWPAQPVRGAGEQDNPDGYPVAL